MVHYSLSAQITVIFMLTVSVVSAATQFSFYRLARGVPGLRDWAAAMALMVVFSVLTIARPALPAFISIIVTNAIILGVEVIVHQGVRRFCGLRRAWAAPLAVAAACLAPLCFLYGADEYAYLILRVILYSAAAGTIEAMSAAVLLRTLPGEGGGRRIAAGFFGLVALLSLVRSLWMIADSPDPHGEPMVGIGSWLIYSYGLLIVLLTFAATAVLSVEGLRREMGRRIDDGERLTRELEEQLRGAGRADGDWLFDAGRWTLAAPGEEPVSLTASEARVLGRLLAMPGQPVSREALCEALGWVTTGAEARNVDGLISRLRRKFSRSTATFPVRSVRNAGYVIDGSARSLAREPAAEAPPMPRRAGRLAKTRSPAAP